MPAFYIILERKIPGVDPTALDGRALSENSKTLDSLAKQACVTPISSFFSMPRAEVLQNLDGEDMGVDIPDEQWFPAEEGLRTIDPLLEAIVAKPSNDGAKLTEELKEFRSVLRAAKKSNVRWHLAIDY